MPRAISAILVVLWLSTVVATPAVKPVPPRTFPASKRYVLTWVPPYAVQKSRARLEESFGGVGMKDGLTHLALQFWMPTLNGGLDRAGKPGDISDATIAAFRDWAHNNGIRVMLCVYNGANSWDWPLARSAFAQNRKRFVQALLTEVERLDLDGVDLDLEGNGSLDADKAAFVAFIRELSTLLHRSSRHLTVDSFAYIWNAPNQNWWPKLLPLVDGLTTMGYEEIGANGKSWRSYAFQKAAAGKHSYKLLLGVPSGRSQWLRERATDHIGWIARDRKVGLAIWDAQMKDSAWREPGLWKSIGSIRGRN